MLAAEVPFAAAGDGTMPKFFGAQNANGAPVASLWITNGLVQVFLVLTLLSNATYQALFSIASVAILVPYAFSGAYAAKLAITGETYASGESRTKHLIVGVVATIYGAWLVYAAGPNYLFMAAMLYVPGIAVYVIARKENNEKMFTLVEAVVALAIVIAGVAAAYLIWSGVISPLSS